jgi:hypothetical protein
MAFELFGPGSWQYGGAKRRKEIGLTVRSGFTTGKDLSAEGAAFDFGNDCGIRIRESKDEGVDYRRFEMQRMSQLPDCV